MLITRANIQSALREAICETLAANGKPVMTIEDATVLVGDDSAFDSTDLIVFVVAAEARLGAAVDAPVRLGEDVAAFEPGGPFRTFGALVEHVCAQVTGV